MSNIGRHSGAAQASVRLTCAGSALDLEIEDHGKGMTMNGAMRGTDRGMGLVSMRERAELMGGELQLRQPPAGGLTVHLHVPDSSAAPAAAPSEVA